MLQNAAGCWPVVRKLAFKQQYILRSLASRILVVLPDWQVNVLRIRMRMMTVPMIECPKALKMMECVVAFCRLPGAPELDIVDVDREGLLPAAQKYPEVLCRWHSDSPDRSKRKVPGSGFLPWKTHRGIRVWERKRFVCRSWMFFLHLCSVSVDELVSMVKTIENHLPDSPTEVPQIQLSVGCLLYHSKCGLLVHQFPCT